MEALGESAIWIIRFYQRYLSPLKGRTCRFHPPCSQYAATAIRDFGLVQGLGLALKRILKCHPFHPGGYDPVPLKTVKGLRLKVGN